MGKNKARTVFFSQNERHKLARVAFVRPNPHFPASFPHHQGSAAIPGLNLSKGGRKLVMLDCGVLAGKQSRARDCGGVAGTRNYRKIGRVNAMNAGGSAGFRQYFPNISEVEWRKSQSVNCSKYLRILAAVWLCAVFLELSQTQKQPHLLPLTPYSQVFIFSSGKWRST